MFHSVAMSKKKDNITKIIVLEVRCEHVYKVIEAYPCEIEKIREAGRFYNRGQARKEG